MSALFKTILKDRILFFGFWICLSCIFLSLVLILISVSHLPQLIPLYNQLPWGQQRLGGKIELFIPLILSILILFINVVLSGRFYDKHLLPCRMLLTTSAISSFLALLFIARTIQLVI